jgi:hypothetical protein
MYPRKAKTQEDRQMTTKGYAFKDIAYKITVFYGHGASKTTEVFYSCLNPECGCKYTLEDLNWLVENGYLFHRVWNGKRGSKQSWGGWNATDHHEYGITRKGWAVAHKYLEA